MFHDKATKPKLKRREIRTISRKVDNIFEILFFGITFPFSFQALFLPFIIFSFSHCCVLWKLFPRFFFILQRRFCKSKRIMNNPNNLLSFFSFFVSYYRPRLKKYRFFRMEKNFSLFSGFQRHSRENNFVYLRFDKKTRKLDE